MNNSMAELQSPFICISLSALDTLISAGDPPYVLTVYAHIIRRAGYNGMCWESVTNMAKYLRISMGSTKKALQLLGDHGLITRESRFGTTSIYRVNKPVTVEVNQNNLGHHMVGVDHNNLVTVEVNHNNLGHHVTGGSHHMTGGSHHMVEVNHNNLGHHMTGGSHHMVEVNHNNLGHHMTRGSHHMTRGSHHMTRGSHHMTRGSHHMTGGGSPHDHKLDPNKLDPYKLDPNKLENQDQESDHFFSDNQEQNPISEASEASEALDQKRIIEDSNSQPKPKTMPKPILKQRNSNHPSDRPIVQIDQTPYNPNAKPDTTCPACGMLSRAFEIERWGMCSFCWQKDKTTHRSPLGLINAS